MTATADAEFWGRLARRINEALSASTDNNIRFLWVDDIIPPKAPPGVAQASAVTTALVSENSGKSFVEYRVLLRFNDAASAAFHAGEWSRLLPRLDRTDWLRISRANKDLEVTLARPTEGSASA